MGFLFGYDYKYLTDTDCSYELALGMIKEKYKDSEVTIIKEPQLPEIVTCDI